MVSDSVVAFVCVCFRSNQLVKILYSFGVFVSFAVQFFVPAEILVPPVCERVRKTWRRAADLSLRAFLVCLTCESTHIQFVSSSVYLLLLILYLVFISDERRVFPLVMDGSCEGSDTWRLLDYFDVCFLSLDKLNPLLDRKPPRDLKYENKYLFNTVARAGMSDRERMRGIQSLCAPAAQSEWEQWVMVCSFVLGKNVVRLWSTHWLMRWRSIKHLLL